MKEQWKKELIENVDLLMPFDSSDLENDYKSFARAVTICFDATKEVMDVFEERDLLWRPTSYDSTKCLLNMFQILTQDSDERDPILAAFSFLFKKRDYVWGELDLEDYEIAAINSFQKRIVEKYSTPQEYLQRVQFFLMLKDQKNSNWTFESWWYPTISHLWVK